MLRNKKVFMVAFFMFYLITVFVCIPLALLTIPIWFLHETCRNALKFWADIYDRYVAEKEKK